MSAPLVIATELPGAAGGLATAAALAVAAASPPAGSPRGVLLIELDADRRRGPTMLASEAARRLERELVEAGGSAAARGRLCWQPLSAGEDPATAVRESLAAVASAEAIIVHTPPSGWRALIESAETRVTGGLLRADLPAQRRLAALAVTELRATGARARIAFSSPGPVAARRALAGLDPGGRTTTRARRMWRGLVGRERGQALPLVLGMAVVLVICALVLAALGGAVTGTARAQRVADLAAISAARSMRDDFERLFAPARLPDGTPNPRHLERPAYLERAIAAARLAASRNDADPGRLRIEFPDARSFAPLRVRVGLEASVRPRLERTPQSAPSRLEATAEAIASPPADASGPWRLPLATDGGYAGPLAYRQGKPMRPDVARAFDRLAAAARRAELGLLITSAFRSDAEQARLFAQHPDPRWVAPPGSSLHRCATELDLGPPAAYAWLAAHAPRLGFIKRYAWEPWHFGYTRGPAPCSAAANAPGAGRPRRGDGATGAGAGLPAYVPSRFRAPISRAAQRWNVPAGLLAAQLLAESNFNPFATSPAGARGIAQFMPGTAAAYGLRDPLDAVAAIDAQAHLMADLLEDFGSMALALAAYNAGSGAVAACGCVPTYPETEAYVARILGLMGGAGELSPPPLEVRLID